MDGDTFSTLQQDYSKSELSELTDQGDQNQIDKQRYPNNMNSYRLKKWPDNKFSSLSERLKNRGFRCTPANLSVIENGKTYPPYGLLIAITEEMGYVPQEVTNIFPPESYNHGRL